MHRSYSLAQPGSLMRAFFLFVLLIGVQFTALTSFVVARGATNTIGNPRLASNKPQVVKPQHTKGKSNPRAPMVGPDLAINLITSSPSYNVGDTVSYTLTVTNGATADSILASPITITDVIPMGLSAVTATSSPAGLWSFTGANTDSPTLVTAMYTGPYPITPGQVLPTIDITGTANGQATGLFTNVATVVIAGDLNLSNNTSTVSVNIAAAAGTPPVGTPPVGTPPVGTPPVGTPPVGTPPVGTPPVGTPPVGTPSVGTSPNITVSNTVEGATSTFQVGQSITYDLIVTNSSTAGPTTGPVVVSDVIPLGLTNLVASGTGWVTNLTDTVGPALLTASYTGVTPSYTGSVAPVVAPGETLPALRLTGILASTADTMLSNTAQAFTAGNSSNVGNSATNPVPTIIHVMSGQNPTVGVGTTTPCTITSISLPCMATATAGLCLTPVTGIGTAVPTTGIGTAVPTTGIGTAVPTTGIGTAVPTTGIGTAVPTVTCPSGPDVAITEAMLTGDSSSALSSVPSASLSGTPGSNVSGTSNSNQYTVGDQASYILLVNALTDGGSVTQPVTVGDVLPIGATNIHVSGSNWVYSISDKTSPAVLTATYNGAYPIAAGTGLSPLMVSLTLTADAVSSFTTSATVDTLGDINLANNTYTNTLFVQEKQDHNNNNDHNNDHNNNHNQNNNNHNQNNNNNNHNQNNNNNNCNCSNHAPGLPGTGSDPSVHIAVRVE